MMLRCISCETQSSLTQSLFRTNFVCFELVHKPRAAATTMSSGSICDNIQAVIQNAISHIPRKASNVSSISIKTDSSIALPIYNKIREELDTIEKLAKVESSNTASESTSLSSKKKRGLDEDNVEE